MSNVSSAVPAYDIDTRLRLLLAVLTEGKNDWKSLERATPIAAEKWRQYARGTTKASVSMVEAIGKTWPQYAFWLVTGVSDEQHGHHAPHEMWAFPNLNPDKEYEETKTGKYSNYEKTTTYFKSASKLAAELWPLGEPRDAFKTETGGKWEKAKEINKHLAADLELLLALGDLKDKEFCLNRKPGTTSC